MSSDDVEKLAIKTRGTYVVVPEENFAKSQEIHFWGEILAEHSKTIKIGTLVQLYRVLNGLSQSELAEKAFGTDDHKHISKIETHEVRKPNANTINLLAKVFGPTFKKASEAIYSRDRKSK